MIERRGRYTSKLDKEVFQLFIYQYIKKSPHYRIGDSGESLSTNRAFDKILLEAVCDDYVRPPRQLIPIATILFRTLTFDPRRSRSRQTDIRTTVMYVS